MSRKILVTTSTFPRWENDVEPSFVYELCRRLKENYRVYVLAPHAPGALLEEQFDNIQVMRYRYFFKGWERLAYKGGILANLKQQPLWFGLVPFFGVSQVVAILKLIHRYSFDLIHAHWLIPQGLCATIARRLINPAPPLLCTSHGGDLFGLNGEFMTRLKRCVLNDASAVTTVSQAMRDAIRPLGVDIEKIKVIPMGVDLQNLFIPPKNRRESKSILFVGRVVEKKGLRFLIEAMPAILEKHPDAKLRVAGDGQELAVIKKLAHNLGVDGRIQFLGAVPNGSLPGLYQTSDVVVFPSIIAKGGDREGFGLVLVEALGCECAVVATDMAATEDIIQDGETALIVHQNDAGQLADKVIRLLNEPEVRHSLGKKGRQYVTQRFDWNVIASSYRELLQAVISNYPVTDASSKNRS
jgi:glycosyltransferase involved in cell wall biosynthesis